MSKNFYVFKEYFRMNGLTGETLDEVSSPDVIGFKDDVHLLSARNQTVAFQIALTPQSGKLDKFNVQFTSLVNADGKEICKCNYAVYAEWFHRLNGKLIPDMLIPMELDAVSYKIPFDSKYLSDQKAGAVWVDLWIAEDVAPGDYKGQLTIEADGETETLNVICHVQSFAIPKENKITMDLNNYTDNISPYFDSLKNNPSRYTDGSYDTIERGFYRLARDHRCLYHTVPYRHSGTLPADFVPELEGEGKYMKVKNWDLFDAHFGPLLDGSAFAGSPGGEHPLEVMYLPFNLGWPANYEKWGQKGYKTEYKSVLRDFIAHFKEKGWDTTYCEIFLNHKASYHFFPYTADEIYYEFDEVIMDEYYDIIQDACETSGVPFIFRVDSSNHYPKEHYKRYAKMCKLWVAAAGHFAWVPESVDVMRENGNILYVYGDAVRSLDSSLMHLYTLPITSMMWGIDGYTAWNTTGYGEDFLVCPQNLGSESLFYPGSYFGVEAAFPSIRLKAMRNAVQLTELMMSTKSSLLNAKVEKFINKFFDKPNKKSWFAVKPKDIDELQPYNWDWDSFGPENHVQPISKGRNPEIIEDLTTGIYDLLLGRERKGPEEVYFRYY